MKAISTTRLLAVGACLVGLWSVGSQKNPVERPLKISAEGVTAVDMTSGEYESHIVANGTQLGTDGPGEFDRLNPVGNPHRCER